MAARREILIEVLMIAEMKRKLPIGYKNIDKPNFPLMPFVSNPASAKKDKIFRRQTMHPTKSIMLVG
jgi:hypothetical protein